MRFIGDPPNPRANNLGFARLSHLHPTLQLATAQSPPLSFEWGAPPIPGQGGLLRIQAPPTPGQGGALRMQPLPIPGQGGVLRIEVQEAESIETKLQNEHRPRKKKEGLNHYKFTKSSSRRMACSPRTTISN